MGDLVRIGEWRTGRAAWRAAGEPRRERRRRPGSGPRGPDEAASPPIERLERAVERLDALTGGIFGGGGRLDPETETALFAIVGEMSMGLVEEAAARTEGLVTRLGRHS